MANFCLEATHVSYAYGDGPLAVRDVSLTATEGSLTAVIGANGSGKSTLIRMLAALLQPRTGNITLDGSPLHQWDARTRARRIAYVPQSTPTAFPFRALDIVLSGRTPYAPRFRFESAHDVNTAMEALEESGAAHLADRPFTALSGGERQMVVLARALAQEPRILLLDEPSSSLDLRHRADLIRSVSRLRRSKRLAVVMITHDLQLTSSFDHLVALRGGEVAAMGSPDEVLREPLLRGIYDDPNVCVQRVGPQALVWVDV